MFFQLLVTWSQKNFFQLRVTFVLLLFLLGSSELGEYMWQSSQKTQTLVTFPYKELKQFIIHGIIHHITLQVPENNWHWFKRLKALNTAVLHGWLLVLYTGPHKQCKFYRHLLPSRSAYPLSWNKPSSFQNIARIRSVCAHLTPWRHFSGLLSISRK